MPFFPIHTSQKINSAKNGLLRIETWFGRTSVICDGVFQSGRYMQKVFQGMLRMLPRDFKPKRILILGLGAGGCMPIVQKRFRNSHIVALEHDEVMIEIAKRTYLRDSDVSKIEIIPGDALQTLPKLDGLFDLILIDLFCGSRVAGALACEEALTNLRQLLAWQGYVIANFFQEAALFSAIFEKYFSFHGEHVIKYNEARMYRNYGMGKMGEGVPNGFKDRSESRDFLRSVALTKFGQQVISNNDTPRLRAKIWPFEFESLTSKREPDCSRGKLVKLLVWQPTQGFNFKGWLKVPSLFSVHFKKGIAILEGFDYWKKWSSTARRNREKFLRDNKHEIIETDFESFASAYHATKFLDPFTRRAFLSTLRHHIEVRSQHVHLSVSRRVFDGKILAGLATIDYPDISQSDHIIAFIHPEAQKSPLGVGLIDEWHLRALRSGIKFLVFGILRMEGNPRAWQGYTDFKRQFHLYEILYPRQVFKIILPK
jgi:precorrin-6B methylase 2